MKVVGRIDTGNACGFSDEQGGPICGLPPAVHGLFLDTWEKVSTGFACEAHGPALERIADATHVAAELCYAAKHAWSKARCFKDAS